ncbi:MAG: MarR family transcriptional regulator [Candidatus Syntrophoarchaeum caldarius]|uniref:MarR family transcriptional regulator n=1 Tax=Candidatus Syntropharchaeum caldarium TaxID=1838285 RepID=A0A1F2P7H4_9EURY|nr:MAG: MarR family transcriptional regulator [Candidatus Syntrophoarchaeum caldarius]
MVKRLFLQDKPAEILLTISEMKHPYTSKVIKQVDTTFAHALKILSAMEELGILKSEKTGRIRMLKLTPYGEKLAKSMNALLMACSQDLDVRTEKKMDAGDQLCFKLDQIYAEEIEGRKRLRHKDRVRISRRLAPYERELKKLEKISKNEDDPVITKIREKIREIKIEKERLTHP